MIKAQGIPELRERNGTNACIDALSFLQAKHREPQPKSAKLLLPITTIGIVACAFAGQPLLKQLYGSRGNTPLHKPLNYFVNVLNFNYAFCSHFEEVLALCSK